MKQGTAVSILDSMRAITKPSVVLIAILALTFYLRLLYFGQYIDADVGNLGYLGWRMAEGEVLIDLEGPGKPPLYFMLYAVFIRLFGASVLGLKMFGAFFVLMAALAVYWVANQAYGKKVGLLAVFFFGVFSSGPMVEGGTVNLETVLHLPYVLAIGLFLKASMSGRLRWYFLAGLCAGLATLVKQVGGVLFFVFLCYGIGERWKKDPPSARRWLYRYLLLGVGALLPVIGIISFYHFHGYTLTQLYDSLLGSNLRYIQRANEFRILLKFFSSSMKSILSENGLLWLGTTFAVAYLGRQIWRNRGQASDRILLWWAFWSFAVLWVTGTFYAHYFLQLIAPFSALAAYGIVAGWKWAKSFSPLPRLVAQGIWTILLVTMVAVFIKTDYKYFLSYTPVEQTIFQYKALDRSADIYGVYNVVQRQIALHILAHSDPTETIYVWGIAPQIYFLSQRKAASRYRTNFNMSRLVIDDSMKALQTYAHTVMEEMRKSPPVYIVQIFRLEDFQGLQTFVQDHYKVEMDIALNVPPYIIRLYRRCHDNQVVLDQD
jgi:4-amino-4-deoxy-L-arabinose transferase-like glycosyltransferase